MFFHLHYRNNKDLLLLNLDVEFFPSGWKLVNFAMNNYMNGFASFVEDEEYFLVKCPQYTNLRKKYFHMFCSEHFDNNYIG